MDRIPLYLIPFVVALFATPLNIFDVHAWNVGIGKSEPWRMKISAGVARVTSALRAFGSFLMGHQRGLAVAALLCLMLLTPHHAHAHGLAGVAIVGQLASGTVAQLEADLIAKTNAGKTLLETTLRACADHVVKAATATEPEVKGRAMTTEEKAKIQAILDEAKGIKAKIDGAEADIRMMAEFNRLTGDTRVQPTSERVPQRVLRSLGAQFVDDPRFREFVKQNGHRQSGAWQGPSIDLKAATVSEAAGSGGPLVLPQVLPGVLPLLFKRLTVGDLLPQGRTTSNALLFMQETTFTNAAVAVAEAAAVPESTLIFAQATSPVQKIAHFLPVTEEMLEDFAALQSYIDARLRLGLDLTEEDELLNGSGVAPHLTGLMNVAGLTAAQAAAADSNSDAIFKEITKIATTAFIQPDGIVINPINWQSVQLAKNANGQYFGAGPWAPAQPPTLWGLPVAVTPSIVANTALVGGFRMCAQEFTRDDVVVQASNSHADFFIKMLVALRAYERLALCIYRPAGFGKVTGLN